MHYVWAALVTLGVFIGVYFITPITVTKLAGITITIPEVMTINLLGVIVGIVIAALTYRYWVDLFKKGVRK